MCDDVGYTWLPAIAYQGLRATGSEALLILLQTTSLYMFRQQSVLPFSFRCVDLIASCEGTMLACVMKAETRIELHA